MTRLLALLLAAFPLPAAYLQCVVLDWDTGRPLARSTVTVEGVQGGQSLSRTTLRTDHAGAAMLGPLADGAYLVTVSRPSFATQQYGQKGWNRPGIPVMVQGDHPLGIQIRLRRLAAISGAVWDENQIGIPNVPVVVYTSARPVKIAARGITDDRGMYRVGELLPGSYVVRNAARQGDDGLSIVPTFYPDGNSLAQARIIEVDLDHAAQEINFQPAPGRLFHITGHVVSPVPRSTGAVELISDTGRISTGYDENGAFSFEAVAPGTYELSAQSQRFAGWIRFVVDRDQEGMRVDMVPLQPVRVLVTERDTTNPVDYRGVALFARRKDLDADGPVIPVVSGRTVLGPGNWEVAVSTAATFYPAGVSSMSQPLNVTPASRADGWTPIQVGRGYEMIKVVVSSHPAGLHGRVVASMRGPAAAVPVFLETLDIDPNEPPQVRTTRTDQNGNYRFTGLPPGRYHVVSSYDLDLASRPSIVAAHPKVVSLRESAEESQDLEILIQ